MPDKRALEVDDVSGGDGDGGERDEDSDWSTVCPAEAPEGRAGETG